MLIIHIFAERTLRRGRRRRISHVRSRTHMCARSPGPGRRSRGAPRAGGGATAPPRGRPPRMGVRGTPTHPAKPPRNTALARRSNFLHNTLVFPTTPSWGVCVRVWVWGRGTATNMAPAGISFHLTPGDLLPQYHTHFRQQRENRERAREELACFPVVFNGVSWTCNWGISSNEVWEFHFCLTETTPRPHLQRAEQAWQRGWVQVARVVAPEETSESTGTRATTYSGSPQESRRGLRTWGSPARDSPRSRKLPEQCLGSADRAT